MYDKNLLRVATRMLIDLLKVLDEDKSGYEIGCKCKTEDVAHDLRGLLTSMLHNFAVLVSIKEETIVIITEISAQPLRLSD